MNIKLFNKIKRYLDIGKPVEVSFYPNHKGCEIFLEKNNYLDDFNFFNDHFGDWWYNGLCDMLISNDAYGDGIEVEFKLNDKSLLANIVLDCSDSSSLYGDTQHNKNEVVTPLLVATLINKLKLSESIFDEELIEFNIDYNGGFSVFEIYYNDKKIKLIKSEIEILKNEISKIIDDWTGPFSGENELNHEVNISINPYDEFSCTDIVNFCFKIKPIE
jgi:hypothetical protein